MAMLPPEMHRIIKAGDMQAVPDVRYLDGPNGIRMVDAVRSPANHYVRPHVTSSPSMTRIAPH